MGKYISLDIALNPDSDPFETDVPSLAKEGRDLCLQLQFDGMVSNQVSAILPMRNKRSDDLSARECLQVPVD